MSTPKAMLPGSVGVDGQPVALGVLGGGQLGRMFVHAAQTLGFATVVLDPDPGSPAGAASNRHVQAAYLDGPGLAEMVARCGAFTTEFENVPAQALEVLSAQRPVSPSAAAVSVCQHRAREKAHFVRAGVPCVPFAVVECEADLSRVDTALFPGILKSATLGYDGKGQMPVDDAGALRAAWRALRESPCVLEQRVRLRCELSVIVARNAVGRFVHLPVQQNLHRDGILAVTQVPAPDVPAPTAALAVAHARTIAESLDYVGVLCVEFFVLQDGSLLANEMAPRPHNSGHYSIDACDVSQFDLQVRTTAGLSLSVPRLHSAAVMLNLLGDLWFPDGADAPPLVPPWDAVLALPGVHLHLYGKSEARPGRKMGHVTVTAASLPSAQAVAREAAGLLGVAPF
jgi:5-(carboxyamino)imidazole ribonucleotide synthase